MVPGLKVKISKRVKQKKGTLSRSVTTLRVNSHIKMNFAHVSQFTASFFAANFFYKIVG